MGRLKVVEGSKFLRALLVVAGAVVFLAGSFVAPVYYITGVALLVIAVAFIVDSHFGPTPIERHRRKLEAIRSTQPPSASTPE